MTLCLDDGCNAVQVCGTCLRLGDILAQLPRGKDPSPSCEILHFLRIVLELLSHCLMRGGFSLACEASLALALGDPH